MASRDESSQQPCESDIELFMNNHTLDSYFQNIVQGACGLLGVPMCAISFIDENRTLFKAHVGFQSLTSGVNTSDTLCYQYIVSNKTPLSVFEIPDTSHAPNLIQNVFVKGPPYIKFYAGTPICFGEEQKPIGTLCVADTSPRSLNDVERNVLKCMGKQAEGLLETLKLQVNLQVQEKTNREQLEELDFQKKVIIDLCDTMRYVTHQNAVVLDYLKSTSDSSKAPFFDNVTSRLSALTSMGQNSMDAISRCDGDCSEISVKETIDMVAFLRDLSDTCSDLARDVPSCSVHSDFSKVQNAMVKMDTERVTNVVIHLLYSAIRKGQRETIKLSWSINSNDELDLFIVPSLHLEQHPMSTVRSVINKLGWKMEHGEHGLRIRFTFTFVLD